FVVVGCGCVIRPLRPKSSVLNSVWRPGGGDWLDGVDAAFRRNRLPRSGMERGTPGREACRERTIEPYVTKAYIPLYTALTRLARIPVQLEGIWLASHSQRKGRRVLQSNFRTIGRHTCLFVTLVLACVLASFAQSPPTGSEGPQPAAPQPAPSPPQNASSATPQEPRKPEVETRDTPAVFKVRVNLVLVRVVVRDAQGKVVENLHQEDFALFDGRKPQVVSFFNVETPVARA